MLALRAYFLIFFFLRQGGMCSSPELLLEKKLEGDSNSQIIFWNGQVDKQDIVDVLTDEVKLNH